MDGARRRRRRRLRTTYQLPKALGIDVEELILTLSLGRVCGDSLSPSPSLSLSLSLFLSLSSSLLERGYGRLYSWLP